MKRNYFFFLLYWKYYWIFKTNRKYPKPVFSSQECFFILLNYKNEKMKCDLKYLVLTSLKYTIHNKVLYAFSFFSSVLDIRLKMLYKHHITFLYYIVKSNDHLIIIFNFIALNNSVAIGLQMLR